jgi:putative SOS response-associated peptidase YedK
MCGRFTLTIIEGLPDQFEIDYRPPPLQPRYNIAPTQDVVVVRGRKGNRKLESMHWGLVPSWADSNQFAGRLINARSETVDRKPSFREAFRQRRCLIPADGFFEWKKDGHQRLPYYFRIQAGEIFAFAGLWESWRGDSDTDFRSCTILTTEPNSLVKDVHDRMPVILPPEAYDTWLSNDSGSTALKSLLAPFPSSKMTTYPVSRSVNSPRNDSIECIQPSTDEPPSQRRLF